MKIIYANQDEIDKVKKALWELLCECDKEFYPPLSQRKSSSQKELSTKLDTNPEGPVAYFNEMIKQEFILSITDDKLSGFMTFKKDYICDALNGFGKSLYITTVCVDKNYRHQGILSLLYDCMETEVAPMLGYAQISTRTWSLNYTQIHSLEKRGYSMISILKDDRGLGVDTLYYGIKIL